MVTAPIDSLSEWQECRTTIGRFDTILADVRKYGFTLVTVLLAANALVTTSNPVVDHVAAAIVVMLLLLVLFMIDNFYWALLQAAVGRALDIEKMDDHQHLSGVLKVKAKSAHATELVLAVYAMYVLISAGIAFAAVIAVHPIAVAGLLILILAVLLELAAMLAVYGWVERGQARWFFILAAKFLRDPRSVMPATPPPGTP
jgi:hypothetical protein